MPIAGRHRHCRSPIEDTLIFDAVLLKVRVPPPDRAAESGRTERVNPKRIYRIMRRNKLLFERCTGDG